MVDKAQILAAARTDLAQQIQIKASVMDKLYNRKVQADKGMNVAGTFEQVSKQVAQEYLVGTVTKEVAFARIDGEKQLCALVVMRDTKAAFDDMVEKSNHQLDQLHVMLYMKNLERKKQWKN